jgi:hypothetical protein
VTRSSIRSFAGSVGPAAAVLGFQMPIAAPILEQTPPLDTVPAYPSWPESPAADNAGS